MTKRIYLTLSTIVFVLCCLYGSVFCAFNSVGAINDLLWDMPFRRALLSINDGSLGILFYVFLLSVIACIIITVQTKADPLSLGLWSFAVLFIIVFTTLNYKEYHFGIIALALIAEAIYSIIVLIKNLKQKEL